MEKTTWKIIAIIFIVLFVLETSFLTWSIMLVNKETEQANICWYDICGEYPEALYDSDVCTCYDYDLLGEYVVAKTEYMK